MPAPLGKTPTKKMPKIEVFGLEDSQPTRAAVRFFRERRIVVRFVDLGKRPIDAAELRAFTDKLGAGALADAAAAGAAGAAGAATDRATLLARVRADPGLLRLPLVRHGNEATAGPAEPTWRRWVDRGKG